MTQTQIARQKAVHRRRAAIDSVSLRAMRRRGLRVVRTLIRNKRRFVLRPSSFRGCNLESNPSARFVTTLLPFAHGRKWRSLIVVLLVVLGGSLAVAGPL